MTLWPPTPGSVQARQRPRQGHRLVRAAPGLAASAISDLGHRCCQDMADRWVGSDPIAAGVVHPVDETALLVTVAAASDGILDPTLIGSARAINDTDRKAGLDISAFPIFDAHVFVFDGAAYPPPLPLCDAVVAMAPTVEAWTTS